MGCVYSSLRKPFNLQKDDSSGDSQKRVFDVVNVDDRQNEINHGQIRITDNDLIFDQKNKASIIWPLRSLRRYGFDQELFSFECGRRCSTGPGIYAFKCVQAEQLFNVLQDVLQRFGSSTSSNNANANNLSFSSPQHIPNGDRDLTVTSSSMPPPSLPRISSPPHSYVNDIRNYMNSPLYVNTGITSAAVGHQLPTHVSVFNCSGSIKAGSLKSASDINTNYAKLDDFYHYVNIHTDTSMKDNEPSQHSSQQPNLINKIDNRRAFSSSNDAPTIAAANLQAQPLSDAQEETSLSKEFKQPKKDLNPTEDALSPHHSRPCSRRESFEMMENPDPLNYVVLDLKNSVNNNAPVCVTNDPATPVSRTMRESDFNLPLASPPSTPTSLKSINNYPPQSYATIDFDKTMALSSSAVNHRKI